MEYFRYKVKDQKGQELEGTISALGQDKAIESLQARGYKVLDIASRDQFISQTVITPHQASSKVAMPPMPTYGLYQYRGSDKQRYFVLGQMSELLRAGVNPAQGFLTLGQNQNNIGFRESLKEMSAASTAGGSISEVMRKYPRLYPEHVIGMTRAGEIGGFLPEALNVAAEQAKEAHAFKAYHWFVWVVVVNLFGSVPVAIIGMAAFRDVFFKTMNSGGSVNSSWFFSEFLKIMGRQLIWPTGPITLAAYLAFGVFYSWLSQDKNKLLRHRIAMRYRVIRLRSKLEGTSIFAWAVARLSRSGVSPQSTWTMACDCVPNLDMKQRLVGAGQMMNEGSKLSEAVHRSDVLPEEYASFTATGEMTGTIPGTFERMSNVAHADYEGQTKRAKSQTGILGCLWLIITSMIGTAIFFYFYGDLLTRLMNEAM